MDPRFRTSPWLLKISANCFSIGPRFRTFCGIDKNVHKEDFRKLFCLWSIDIKSSFHKIFLEGCPMDPRFRTFPWLLKISTNGFPWN